MGGTLAARGGHNILEPALFGKAVIVGPHMENFAGIAEEFRAAGAVGEVGGAEELGGAVERVLADDGGVGARARQCAEARRGATARAVAAMRELYRVPRYRPAMPWYLLAWALARVWCWEGRRRQSQYYSWRRKLGVAGIRVGNITMGGTGKKHGGRRRGAGVVLGGPAAAVAVLFVAAQAGRAGHQRGQSHHGRNGQDTVRAAPGGVVAGARAQAGHSDARLRESVAVTGSGASGGRDSAHRGARRGAADFPAGAGGAGGDRGGPLSQRHFAAGAVRRECHVIGRWVPACEAGAGFRCGAGGRPESVRLGRSFSGGTVAGTGRGAGAGGCGFDHPERGERSGAGHRTGSAALESAGARLSGAHTARVVGGVSDGAEYPDGGAEAGAGGRVLRFGKSAEFLPDAGRPGHSLRGLSGV